MDKSERFPHWKQVLQAYLAASYVVFGCFLYSEGGSHGPVASFIVWLLSPIGVPMLIGVMAYLGVIGQLLLYSASLVAVSAIVYAALVRGKTRQAGTRHAG